MGRSRWKAVSAATCDFTGSDIGDAELSSVRLDDCRLSGANLFGTSLLGIDMTTCLIDGIVTSDSMAEVRGCKMDTHQAAAFARKLGILIADA